MQILQKDKMNIEKAPLDTGRKLNLRKPLQDFQNILRIPYVRLIYVLCPGG